MDETVILFVDETVKKKKKNFFKGKRFVVLPISLYFLYLYTSKICPICYLPPVIRLTFFNKLHNSPLAHNKILRAIFLIPILCNTINRFL